jgi:hypothetical protein
MCERNRENVIGIFLLTIPFVFKYFDKLSCVIISHVL